jgi:type IV secretory pathway TrbF-like protein
MRFSKKAMHPESRTPASAVIIARREFETVFSDLARGKRNWQLMAFAAMGLLGVREVAYQRYAAGSRITPYVVEVDRLGVAQAFGPAEALKATDRRVTIAELATFIRNLRMVVPNMVAQADLTRRAYAYITPTAATFLNSYFSVPEHDPRALGKAIARQVEVTSVLQLPGTNTWKVQWTETETSVTGATASRVAIWEAYLATTVIPPATTETIELNPLGLYVTSMTWSRIAMRTADSVNTTLSEPPP